MGEVAELVRRRVRLRRFWNGRCLGTRFAHGSAGRLDDRRGGGVDVDFSVNWHDGTPLCQPLKRL